MGYLPDIGYPQTYDRVQPGTYVCMQCQNNDSPIPSITTLIKPKTLPECEHCGITYWMKI